MMELVLGIMSLMPLIFFKVNYWMILSFLFMFVFKFMLKLGLTVSKVSLSYGFGVDLLSYFMILLSLWICCLMILASGILYEKNFYWKLFIFMIIVLVLSLVLTFSSLNFFMFYLFFEASLIPTLFLILGWGIQPERIMAGAYLLFYTLLVSLPMMLSLFYLYKVMETLEFYFLWPLKSLILYILVNFIFFVKMPMFFVHLWLPKAHVEAPVSGSMILAGVMLKLGGYGLMRVMKIFVQVNLQIGVFIMVVSLTGGMIVSFVCLRQSDMKMLIAYSSISHMGLVLGGILTLNSWGLWGSLVLMLAHGLCSSGLFCLANLMYERSHSRSIYLNKGFMNILPSLALWAFLLCSSNMAAPPSLNLMGEILLMISLLVYSKLFMLIMFILLFNSAVYSLFLYSFTQHGLVYSGMFSFSYNNVREYSLLFLHWVPLNILVFKSEYMSMWL
uniref:NADH-ubiquinone oxidoreductase chain 4 n=1 Tax=Trigonopterus porg TaxID=2678944 RepID=A0A7H1KI52_9CUCU|nr:NADH dehydrogenase subunit 4 [Trigonopterus porg]QNT26968.1 NADH dehydrogenase subunit 4 [Trigonopterus porg]